MGSPAALCLGWPSVCRGFWGWVCPDCSNQSVSSLVRIKATRDDSDEANEAPKK